MRSVILSLCVVSLIASCALAGDNIKGRDLPKWYADRKEERLLDIEKLQREIEEAMLAEKDTKEKEALLDRLITQQFMPPELDFSLLDVGDMGIIINRRDSSKGGGNKVSLVFKQNITVDRKKGYLLQYKVWEGGRPTRHVGWIINLGLRNPPQITITDNKDVKSRIYPVSTSQELAKVIQMRTVTLPTGEKVRAAVLTLWPIPEKWIRLPKATVDP